MLKARLTQTGKRNAHSYRIIISEARSKRDGHYLDLLGMYNPSNNPTLFELDEKKLQDWVQKGAQISTGLTRLLNDQKVAVPTPKKTTEPKSKKKTTKKATTKTPAKKKATAKKK